LTTSSRAFSTTTRVLPAVEKLTDKFTQQALDLYNQNKVDVDKELDKVRLFRKQCINLFVVFQRQQNRPFHGGYSRLTEVSPLEQSRETVDELTDCAACMRRCFGTSSNHGLHRPPKWISLHSALVRQRYVLRGLRHGHEQIQVG